MPRKPKKTGGIEKSAGVEKVAAFESWEDMPLAEFERRAVKAQELAVGFTANMNELFPGLTTLTGDQRVYAPRLRSGEHGHLLTVLDVADSKPALFESLADSDEGMDPGKFETDLLRDRIKKHKLLGQIADTLSPIATHFGDSTLYLATRFRESLSAAYRIAKAHAETDKKVSTKLAPVIDFMRKASVVAAAKRVKK